MKFLYLPVQHLQLTLVKDGMRFIVKSPFWRTRQNGNPKVLHQLMMNMEESNNVESA